MKKYIIIAASALCIAAVSNAQAGQKQSTLNNRSTTMAVHTVTIAKNAHAPMTAVAAKNTSTPKETTIKRKHHKKTVHPKKMVTKK